jgi:drug/metabolite transporter (DMT)-like permease
VTAPNALDHVRPVFRRIITWGAVLAVALAIVGGVVGLLVADTPGLVGGLLGAVLSVVFLGLTAVSVLVALRVSKGQMISGAFFGIVMGTWLLKFIVFIVLLVALKDRTWVDFPVLAIVIIAGVVGSLVIDVVAVAKARIPIGVQLPGDGSGGSADAENPTPRN